MQRWSYFLKRFTVVACLVFAGMMLDGTDRNTSAGGIIYFTEVVSRLSLSAQQRPRVQSIISQSESATLAIFSRYGIDPRATPDPSKLRPAQNELEAVGRRERNQLKQILDKGQLKKYDSIMRRLRARVARAAAGNLR